jgi:hypothetical protein
VYHFDCLGPTPTLHGRQYFVDETHFYAARANFNLESELLRATDRWADDSDCVDLPIRKWKRGFKMSQEAHKKAAEAHDQASRSHKEAATQHEQGNHESATEHSKKAHDHSSQAHQHSTDAHSQSSSKK